MAAALAALSFCKDRRNLTSRQFAILREAGSAAKSGPMTSEQLARHHEIHLGRKRSLETRKRIAEKAKGRKSHNKGVPTPEHIRAKMRKPKQLKYATCTNCGYVGTTSVITRHHKHQL